MFLMPKAVSALTKLTDKESTRYALNGIQVNEDENAVRYAATDGRILGVMTVAKTDEDSQFPFVPGFDHRANGAHTAIVPADAITAAVRSLPKGRKIAAKPVIGNVAVTLSLPEGAPDPNRSEITLATTDYENPAVRTVLSIDGRFPKIDEIWPMD